MLVLSVWCAGTIQGLVIHVLLLGVASTTCACAPAQSVRSAAKLRTYRGDVDEEVHTSKALGPLAHRGNPHNAQLPTRNPPALAEDVGRADSMHHEGAGVCW